MTKAEYLKRMEDEHYKELEVTKEGDGLDYVFISYKSDDWEVVLSEIVYKLQKNYNLRVYFDKSFNTENDIWVKQFRKNMSSSHCKAIICFIDEAYYKSYATATEILFSQTNRCTMWPGKRMPIVSVILDDIENDVFSDDGDTGLGNKKNRHYQDEKKAFVNAFKVMDRVYRMQHAKNRTEYDLDGLYEYENEDEILTKSVCARIVHEVLGQSGTNDNQYEKSESFIEDLEGTIRSVAPSAFAGSKEDLEVRAKETDLSFVWIQKMIAELSFLSTEDEDDEDFDGFERTFSEFLEYAKIALKYMKLSAGTLKPEEVDSFDAIDQYQIYKQIEDCEDKDSAQIEMEKYRYYLQDVAEIFYDYILASQHPLLEKNGEKLKKVCQQICESDFAENAPVGCLIFNMLCDYLIALGYTDLKNMEIYKWQKTWAFFEPEF